MAVDHVGITTLAKELGQVPAELRRHLRPQLRAGGQHIVSDMKARASYSSRIPGAISMTVSFAARGGGVRFRVNARRAPHARVLERGNDGSRSSSFRHPVYGDRDAWVSQPTRPFFFPAARAGREQLKRNITDAVKASLPGRL